MPRSRGSDVRPMRPRRRSSALSAISTVIVRTPASVVIRAFAVGSPPAPPAPSPPVPLQAPARAATAAASAPRLIRREVDGAIVGDRPALVPGDLPRVAVRVHEDARVAAPE